MRIGIDARFYGSIGKGLGRYTQKLIEHLEQIPAKGGPASGWDQNQYVVFLRQENFDEFQIENENFQKVLADYRWYSFSEQIFFPFLLKKHKLDLMHFPHFNVPLFYFGKFVITIHDLILIHFPTLRSTTLNPLWYRLKFWAYKINIFSAIRRSSRIFAVSEFTKNDILSHYKVDESKIVVTHEACENYCRIGAENSEQILKKYGIIKPYLLYVGNAYPHKNLETLVDAFELIKRTFDGVQLVLVGKEDYFYLRLKNYVLQKKITGITFSGFVPDSDLDVLYRFCSAYVFPSLYEGFGLPPLEAMAKGAAVVSSDHECMREILGDAALYVDAKSPEALSAGISKIMTDNGLKNSLVEKGYEQIKKYSWDEMARQTLENYSLL